MLRNFLCTWLKITHLSGGRTFKQYIVLILLPMYYGNCTFVKKKWTTQASFPWTVYKMEEESWMSYIYNWSIWKSGEKKSVSRLEKFILYAKVNGCCISKSSDCWLQIYMYGVWWNEWRYMIDIFTLTMIYLNKQASKNTHLHFALRNWLMITLIYNTKN